MYNQLNIYIYIYIQYFIFIFNERYLFIFVQKLMCEEKQNAVNFGKAIRKPIAIKAISLGIYLVIMQQFACGNPISAYGQTIFEKAHLNFPASIVPVIYLFSSLFGFLAVILVNKYLTLKTALLVSGFGCGIFTVSHLLSGSIQFRFFLTHVNKFYVFYN